MSHGRNLLNKRAYQEQIATYENGYENPYCRTWTYHHQYANYGDTIRPMATKQYDDTYSVAGADTIQKRLVEIR